MRIHVSLVAAVALPLVMASGAAGQSLFVSGGGFANILKVSDFASQSPSVVNQNLSDTTPGFDLSVGGSLATHVVVQFELALPRTIHKTYEPVRYLPPIPPPTLNSVTHVDYQTRHALVLAGYQTSPKGRVSVALLGGVMFVQERSHSLIDTVGTPVVGPLPIPSESTSTNYHLSPVLGIDVPISTMAHLAVVPHARVYKMDASTGIIGIWPGVDVRWTF